MRTFLWCVAAACSALSLACDGGIPPRSSTLAPPTAVPAASPSPLPISSFTVSGVVTEYRAGPLADVTVRARPNFPPGNGTKTTLTDMSGFYRISGLTESIIIDVSKEGYELTGFGAFTGDRIVNLTMNRQLHITAGQTLNATIWGDSELSGEDWTGATCDHKACAMIHVVASSPGKLIARLTWSGRGNELGVFISTGFFGGSGAFGSSPLEASLDVRAGETLVVVSFEKSAGGGVPPSASQDFELATALVPR